MQGDDGGEVVQVAGGGPGFADGVGDAAVTDGQAGTQGVQEGVEGAGAGGAVAVGQGGEIGFVDALQENVESGGGVLGAEENPESGSGVRAGVGREQCHEASVQALAERVAGGVAAGLGVVHVGDDAGEPDGHWTLSSG